MRKYKFVSHQVEDVEDEAEFQNKVEKAQKEGWIVIEESWRLSLAMSDVDTIESWGLMLYKDQPREE